MVSPLIAGILALPSFPVPLVLLPVNMASFEFSARTAETRAQRARWGEVSVVE